MVKVRTLLLYLKQWHAPFSTAMVSMGIVVISCISCTNYFFPGLWLVRGCVCNASLRCFVRGILQLFITVLDFVSRILYLSFFNITLFGLLGCNIMLIKSHQIIDLTMNNYDVKCNLALDFLN